MEFKQVNNRSLHGAVVLGCLLVSGAVAFSVYWVYRDCNDTSNANGNYLPNNQGVLPTKAPEPSAFISKSGKYHYAAVASESKVCSDIGTDMMARHHGNAIDAAVATMICNGVEHPHSSGIGGGSFFLVYIKNENKFYAVNARETAPAGATKDMYVNDPLSAKLGGKAIGIPGEVKGMVDVHKRFGKVPWKTLVMPTVKLLRDGYVLNPFTQKAVVGLKDRKAHEVFLDKDGTPLPAGSIIKDPKLAKTMEIIANDPTAYYTSSNQLAKDIVQDIQENGGIINAQDLENYVTTWTNTTVMELPGNMTVHSMPPPGSGPVLTYILSILAGYGFSAQSVATEEARILTYHRIVEAMKFAYGLRSELGDAAFVDVEELVNNLTSREFGERTRQKISDAHTLAFDQYESSFYNVEDHGTNHLSVLDVDGNAVGITSTVNLYFGSKVVGPRTGIVFNNEMDDFSTPNLTNSFGFAPSASNFIEPGKRPQSSMTPTIVFDNTNQRVKMIVGAAGGSRITSTTATMLMDVLWFNKSMIESMDTPRLHHQLLPNKVSVDKYFPQGIRDGLKSKGHEIAERGYMSVAHAIARIDDIIEAVSDFNKGGAPGGY